MFVQESSLHLFVTSMTLYVFIFAEDKVFLLKKKKQHFRALRSQLEIHEFFDGSLKDYLKCLSNGFID